MTRLSPERLEELYRGTLQLVAEVGFERITMDQIAEATRSSKATLYRQWGSKAVLVAEAIRNLADIPDDVPDTGSLRGDLVEMIDRRSRVLEAQGDLIGSLLASLRDHDDLCRALRDEVVARLRTRLRAVLDRAVGRGEVAADNPALDHVDLVLMAPFVLRVVVDDAPPDEAYLHGYVDAVLLPALGVRARTA